MLSQSPSKIPCMCNILRWVVRQLDLQQVPSLQNVHEVQEVQWVQAGQSYRPYQQIQQIQMGPANRIKGNSLNVKVPLKSHQILKYKNTSTRKCLMC